MVTFGFDFSSDGASNNVEEYRGLIAGLRVGTIASTSDEDRIVVLGDSQLIINQVTGECNCGENLSEWLDIALSHLQSSLFSAVGFLENGTRLLT